MRYCGFRYGKPLVLDMMEVDMFDTVSDRFDEIQKGLMDQIMDRSIVKEEKCVVVVFVTRLCKLLRWFVSHSLHIVSW